MHDNFSPIQVNHILRITSISHCMDISYVFLHLIFRIFIFIDAIKTVTLFITYVFKKVNLKQYILKQVLLVLSLNCGGWVIFFWVGVDDRDGWGFFLGVVEMSTFNFLTWKSISPLSKHHRFKYFSQPCWDIQGCEKLQIMERWKPSRVYRSTRRPLHESRYKNWPIWNSNVSYRLLVKFVQVFTCLMKFISG